MPLRVLLEHRAVTPDGSPGITKDQLCLDGKDFVIRWGIDSQGPELTERFGDAVTALHEWYVFPRANELLNKKATRTFRRFRREVLESIRPSQ